MAFRVENHLHFQKGSYRYLLPEKTLSFLYYPQCVGHEILDQGYYFSRNNLNSCLLSYVVKGQATLVYHDVSYALKPHSLIFIDCHQQHSYQAVPGTEIYFAHIMGANTANLQQAFFSRFGPLLHLEDGSEFIKAVEGCYTYRHDHPLDYDKKTMSDRAYQCLLPILWALEKGSESKKSLAGDVRAYIDREYEWDLSLDALAKRFGVDKFFLIRIFSKEFEMTPHQYLLYKRVMASLPLLEENDLLIRQISETVGFKEVALYINQFSKILGETPRQYRLYHQKEEKTETR